MIRVWREKKDEFDRTYYSERRNSLAAFSDESKTRKINETEQKSKEKKRELIDSTETLSYWTFTGTWFHSFTQSHLSLIELLNEVKQLQFHCLFLLLIELGKRQRERKAETEDELDWTGE